MDMQLIGGREIDYEHWGRVAVWSLHEAAALVCGENPSWVTITSDNRYEKTLDLARRAATAGILTDPINPPSFLRWADQNGIKYPAELAHHTKTSTNAGENIAELIAERDLLRVELEATKRKLSQRRYNTMLKLIAGLAFISYPFDPKAQRNSVAREISDDLLKHGISISDDTIRSILREGTEEIDLPPKD